MNTTQEDGHPGGTSEGNDKDVVVVGARRSWHATARRHRNRLPSPPWQRWPRHCPCHSGMGALPDHTGHANTTRKRTMHKDVVYARLYAAFFQEHPEMLTEVRYIPMPDGDEPELVMSFPAVRCLLVFHRHAAPSCAAQGPPVRRAGAAAPDDPAHRVRRRPRQSALCTQAMRAPPAVFRRGVHDRFL